MKSINFAENNNVVRNDVINAYMSEINRFKTINDADVRILIKDAQKGNERARAKVINANLRIVWSIAAHYNGMDNFEDILQNGNIGLIKAVDTFDVSRETKFTTWALEMIRKYINIGLTNESRVVRQGAHQVKAKNVYNMASFDAPIASDEDGEKTLLDTFASEMSADNFSKVEDMRVKINYLMQDLKPIEKEIVCGLFGLGCREYTQYELSRKFKYTEERIRQIKFEALKKMAQMA